MAFKLKSGNSPMFKKVGEEKETAEQYNAKVRAEYEAKLQAHSDSTASYNKAVIIDDLYNKGQGVKDKGTKVMLDAIKYKQEDLEGFDEKHGCGKGFFADARGQCIEGSIEGGKVIKEAEVLEGDLRKTKIYPTEERRFVKTGDGEFAYTTTAESIKPGPKPTKPMEMIDRMKIKNIDMGEPTPSGVIEPSKRKYMTSDDGKYKYNLETGERSKVNTQKVKNTRRPGKRSVKNLVTSGTNRVQ
tara:strand:- start:423 stop:1151 length:729 start_codon:yes stop_codon:yes gene_type:complete